MGTRAPKGRLRAMRGGSWRISSGPIRQWRPRLNCQIPKISTAYPAKPAYGAALTLNAFFRDLQTALARSAGRGCRGCPAILAAYAGSRCALRDNTLEALPVVGRDA